MKHASITLLLSLSTLTCLFADPPQLETGYYVGVLRVTKVHYIPDDLSSSYTLRAQARVYADGSISLATTAPESPAAASNVESTLTKATPLLPPVNDPPVVIIEPPLLVLSRTNPVTLVEATANYVVDSKHKAELTASGNLLKLVYSNPAAGLYLSDVHGTSARTNPQFTAFQYTLRKQQR